MLLHYSNKRFNMSRNFPRRMQPNQTSSLRNMRMAGRHTTLPWEEPGNWQNPQFHLILRSAKVISFLVSFFRYKKIIKKPRQILAMRLNFLRTIAWLTLILARYYYKPERQRKQQTNSMKHIGLIRLTRKFSKSAALLNSSSMLLASECRIIRRHYDLSKTQSII